ncbi:hypothetical protein ABZ894_28860 [Nocardia beijingensis]|uniref:hypothetical protein n=1 Tax=Nocardia beijingensis TaxID=95162 RepID=UPI0033FD4D2A
MEQLAADAEREAAAVRSRLDQVLCSGPNEFRASSDGARAIVSCDARGRVLDLALPHGLTGGSATPWEVQEQVDRVGRAIVTAVNEARAAAAEAGYQQCRQAFPGWFDLLTDLQPEQAAQPTTTTPRTLPMPPQPVRPSQPARYVDDDEEDGPPASWLE